MNDNVFPDTNIIKDIVGRDVPTIYHVDDTWPNNEKLKMRINARYTEWRKLKLLLQQVNAPAETGDTSSLRVAV